MFSKSQLLLPLLALPYTLAAPTNRSITWLDCSQDLGFPAECGSLPVPLDYTDEASGKTLNLSMLKVKANKEPVKGSIFINPGGPGNDAQSFLTLWGREMLVMTGGHFNVIGVDPRGTGKTLPVECFATPLEELQAGLTLPPSIDAYDTALGTTFAITKVIADSCYENMGEVGALMGTAYTARDILQVVDALGEDGLVRFWGQSYGTMLGATLAAMFPDRIDKLVIDGVANLHDYTDGWEYDNLGVGELALQEFLEACIKAGEEACPLASKGSTADELFTIINDLGEQVRREPITLGSNITTDVVTFSQISSSLDSSLRISLEYAPYLAGYLNAILDRNATAYHAFRAFIVPDMPSPLSGVQGTFGIRCSDTVFRAHELADVEARADKVLAGSRLFGGGYGSGYMMCSQWRFNAKGRYEGDFKAKTKNPALIIGSPFDLRTPLKSAVNASASLEGSVVLQHKGHGHCLLYSPGQCGIKAVQDYFTNGTLPAPGTVCEQDFDVFSGKSISDSFGTSTQTSNGTSSTA
ncbi:Nn.00g061370.m01.CDS01 [Neocucurbitaria sp. VM-36]